MKRTWLTALVPIALAFTALLVSAATEHVCVGQPLPVRDAGDRFSGDVVSGAIGSGCNSFDGSKQISQVAFERATYYVAVQTFSFAPEPSISALLGLGLASLAFLHRQVIDVKPLIRRKPP
jgi:hypothetical protein